MTKLLNQPAWLEKVGQYSVFSDFNHYVTADEFTTVATDAGAAAVADGAKGILAITPSDGTVADNDETYIKSTIEIFKFAAGKPLLFEALVQFTEGATDDANVIVGVKDAVAANTLLDDGGGPAASYSGAVFFKVDGGTLWQVESSIAGAQTTSTTDVTAGGAAYQKLRLEYRPISATQGEVVYFIDDQQCQTAPSGGTIKNAIKHIVTFATATEMQVCIGMKNGAVTTVETLNVDYVGCDQLR